MSAETEQTIRSKWIILDSILANYKTISVREVYDILCGIDPNATYESARAHMFHLRESGKAILLNYEKDHNEVYILDL